VKWFAFEKKSMSIKNNLLLIFTVVFTNVFSQNISNGLIGYYPFDGDANDYSGGGRHGTLNGAVLTEGIDGLANTAYDFVNGSIGILDSVNFPKDYMSVSAWILMDSISQTQAPGWGYSNMIYGATNSLSTVNTANWEADYNFKFTDRNDHKYFPICTLSTCLPEVDPNQSNNWCYYSTDYQFEDSVNVSVNKWVHILFEIDQGVFRFLVNGVNRFEETSASINLRDELTYAYGKIGAEFMGSIDQLRIYNRS
jgi:hypothetical protein